MSDIKIPTIIKSGQVYIKKYKELKPQTDYIRPGYDMEYCKSMISHYYPNFYENNPQFFDNEKEYDRLSIIKQGETPVQWKSRIINGVYTLLTQGKFSVYHGFCLFAGTREGKHGSNAEERPLIHNSRVALCFRCWKLFRADDVMPKDTYHHGWKENIKMIEPEDLMQRHWNFECDDPLTDFGRERVKQQHFTLTHSASIQPDYTNLDVLTAYFGSMQMYK
jgi:hypothetical protein